MSARRPAERGRWVVAAERGAHVTKVPTLAGAARFGVVTLVAVGCGDAYPATAAGRVITGVFIPLTLTTIGFLLTALTDAARWPSRQGR